MLPSQLNPVTNSEMQEAISRALAQGFSGRAEVTFALGDRATLLIQAGKVVEVLAQERTRKKRLAGTGWPDLFVSPQMGVVALQSSTGRGLVFERACFEVEPVEEKTRFPNTELENLFATYDQQESATVFSVRWNNAQGYVLVPGSNLRLRRAVFTGGEHQDSDDAALATMTYWRESTCQVSIFKNGLENDLWIGLHLNVLFEYLTAHLLAQYGYLTGKVMVSSMVRNAIYAASQLDCEMVNISSRLQDHTLFNTVDETRAAYKDMLAFMEQQMESMLGSNFIVAAKAHALDALNPFYTSLARLYGFSA